MAEEKNFNQAILEKVKAYTPSLAGMKRCNRFAVCIPLAEPAGGGGYELLFEVRSAKIDRQPGDICFPGGMLEPGETPAEAALRETREELLVEESQLELLGMTDTMVEDGGMVLYTFASVLKGYRGTYSGDEVESVFAVPLQALLEMEPERYYITEHTVPDENFPFDRIRMGREYPWRKKREEILFYTWKDKVIWGITAKLLEAFLDVCR